MKPIIKIPTTGDLQLNIQIVECNQTNHEGIKRIDNEICLIITGENTDSNDLVEEFVTISKEETINLAYTLIELVN